MIFIFSSLFI